MHKRSIIIILFVTIFITASAKVTLTLDDAIRIAADSSLISFSAKNLYMSGYLEYRSYKAARLPSLSLNLTPVSYNRFITTRYDSQDNIDVYRNQQMFSSEANLQLNQNFDLLGGTFYLQSGLGFLRNFGEYSNSQFSSIPVRIGYIQNLLGYNPFRWQKNIEPLKYEQAQKEFIYNMEQLSETTIGYFFELAMAQTDYHLARENLSSADTLYSMGERRFEIAAISQAELLTLRLDRLNASNSLENSRIAVRKAMFSLASHLGMDQTAEIEVSVPEMSSWKEISVEEAITLAKLNNPLLLEKHLAETEAKEALAKAKVESVLNASLSASVGFNQTGSNLRDAYDSPLRQDIVSVSMTIPLVDWGVRKGKRRVAENSLSLAEIAKRQQELSLEEEVMMAVSDYEIQKGLISSAAEARELAEVAYEQTKQRFIIGKTDLSALTLANNRRQEAAKNYVIALKNYWQSHYKLRRLTLFDFERGIPLTIAYNLDHYVK